MAQHRQGWWRKIPAITTTEISLTYFKIRFLRRPLVAAQVIDGLSAVFRLLRQVDVPVLATGVEHEVTPVIFALQMSVFGGDGGVLPLTEQVLAYSCS